MSIKHLLSQDPGILGRKLPWLLGNIAAHEGISRGVPLITEQALINLQHLLNDDSTTSADEGRVRNTLLIWLVQKVSSPGSKNMYDFSWVNHMPLKISLDIVRDGQKGVVLSTYEGCGREGDDCIWDFQTYVNDCIGSLLISSARHEEGGLRDVFGKILFEASNTVNMREVPAGQSIRFLARPSEQSRDNEDDGREKVGTRLQQSLNLVLQTPLSSVVEIRPQTDFVKIVTPAVSNYVTAFMVFLQTLHKHSKSSCGGDLQRPDVIFIGKDPSLCHVVIDHPSVSRLHCVILIGPYGVIPADDTASSTVCAKAATEEAPPGWCVWLADLDSSNGTFVVTDHEAAPKDDGWSSLRGFMPNRSDPKSASLRRIRSDTTGLVPLLPGSSIKVASSSRHIQLRFKTKGMAFAAEVQDPSEDDDDLLARLLAQSKRNGTKAMPNSKKRSRLETDEKDQVVTRVNQFYFFSFPFSTPSVL